MSGFSDSESEDVHSGQRIGTGRRLNGLYQLDQLHIPSSTTVGIVTDIPGTTDASFACSVPLKTSRS